MRQLLYVGVMLDSELAMAFLPLERAQALQKVAERVRVAPTSSALTVQSLLGHMAASIVVVPFAWHHMKPVQLWLLHSFRFGVDAQSKLLHPPQPVRNSFIWWTSLSNLQMGVPFLSPQPEATLTTDASLWGWGAHLNATCAGGSLAGVTQGQAHQLSGADGHISSSSGVSRFAAGSSGLDFFGQYDSGRIPGQAGRYGFKVSLRKP